MEKLNLKCGVFNIGFKYFRWKLSILFQEYLSLLLFTRYFIYLQQIYLEKEAYLSLNSFSSYSEFDKLHGSSLHIQPN